MKQGTGTVRDPDYQGNQKKDPILGERKSKISVALPRDFHAETLSSKRWKGDDTTREKMRIAKGGENPFERPTLLP